MSNENTVAVVTSPVQQLDMALLRYAEFQQEKERLNHNMKLAKENIERLVREHNLGGHQTPIQGTDKDLKVTVSQKQVRVLDVAELSSALGVTDTEAKKKEVLMRAIAEGRLTLAAYEGFHYYEPQDKFSIRKVKAAK